jgi:hypothetical protein
VTTAEQDEPFRPDQETTEASQREQRQQTEEMQRELGGERQRAEDAEAENARLQQRVAELEQQLANTGQPTPTEPVASDAASLEQQGREPIAQPPQETPSFATAPIAGDAASLVQQDAAPPVTSAVELTPAQEEGAGLTPEPAEEDPAATIAAGGHLDAAGKSCYCDRGGGHAPLTEDERQAIAMQPARQQQPSGEPLSADERAELEQLRAERAERAQT